VVPIDLNVLESVVRERMAIRRDAYFRWLHRNNRGKEGDALRDWVEAERQHTR